MALGNLRGRNLSLVVGLVGALGFMLQGYDQAVANGLLTLKAFVEEFPAIDTLNTSGARKAHNSTIQGLGVGGFTATIPMYVAENTRAKNRGQMVLLQGFFAIGGIVIASWLEFGLYYVNSNPVSWRFPIAFQSIFAIGVVAGILFLPESPRWLVRQDRMEDAAKVLAQLEDTDGDNEAVSRGLDVIRQSLEDDRGGGKSRNPFGCNETRNFHRTCLAVGVNIIAQMSGINIITFYSDTILEADLGYSGNTSRIISGCLQIWQFICAGLAILLIDRVGRRVLIIVAALGMAISHACLAGLSSNISNKSVASASLLFYFLAFFCFPIGLFLVPFMYAAEIAPLQTRAKVTAMSAAANWLFNFLIAEVTPVGFDNIGWKYYLIYASISVVGSIIFYFFYPETKGRSLEEIDDIFLQSTGVFDPVRIAGEMPFHTDVLAVVDEKATDIYVENV
ncbi:hypothetical protein Plec18167_005318 [Paecilomyces lecythidis]|uniref:Major facilitator superfamily (MFS) profile domain-containing protein n=1 Tax=Paecilomyces lecythidis TaxID=3004212 RepID=A0ABR3XK15_9EURO